MNSQEDIESKNNGNTGDASEITKIDGGDQESAETAFVCRSSDVEKEQLANEETVCLNETEIKDTSACCKSCILPDFLSKWCPPRGFFGHAITRVLVCFTIWASLWAILGENALPGSNIFSLVVLLVVASFFGFLVRKIPFITFPPLLGMLIAGFLLRNVPGISVAKHIDKQWSSTLRNTALVVILLRSGLGLDIQALRRLKCTVIRLAFCPCLLEAVTVGIVSHFLLGMPWLWAFMLGYI